MKVDLQIVNGIFLTAQQKHDLVIDELKLPRHFFINIIYFVHGSDRPVHCLEISQVFMECVLHFALLLSGQGQSLFAFDSFSHQVFLAAVGYQQSSWLFECFFSLESVQDNQGSFLTLVHIESIGQDNNHEGDNEGSPNH